MIKIKTKLNKSAKRNDINFDSSAFEINYHIYNFVLFILILMIMMMVKNINNNYINMIDSLFNYTRILFSSKFKNCFS